MGKVFKRILIIACVLLAAGVVIWAIGMTVIGWDFERLDANEYTQKSFAAQSSVEKIDVTMQSFPLTVVRGDGVSLEYYETESSQVSVECTDGVLSIHEKYTFNPFKTGLFDFGRFSHRYVLTVTDGAELNIDVVNGNVKFDGLSFDKLNVNSTNADMTFERCEVGELTVKATNADIVFADSTLGDVNIDSTNFAFKADDTTVSDMTVDATNADVELKNTELDSFKLDATNITMSMSGGYVGTIAVDGTNTDCTVKNVRLEHLDLHGTNLHARITISGAAAEYSVTTRGKDLPAQRQGSTDKSITISGTNNSVTLAFTE